MGLMQYDTQELGFTLTEILVVSVIVAIVSAVAVPVYTNYIKEQRIETARNLAQAAAVSANVIYRRTGSPPDCDITTCPAVLDLFLTEPARYKVTIEGNNVKVKDVDHDLEAEVAFK